MTNKVGQNVPNARPSSDAVWQSQFLVTPKKAMSPGENLGRGFPNRGRSHLIDEDRFAPDVLRGQRMSQPGGADQSSVVHLLKEMFTLTDDEALEQRRYLQPVPNHWQDRDGES